MRKFCADLRKDATEKIKGNATKKQEKETRQRQEKKYIKEDCHICRLEFSETFNKDENYQRVQDHCHYTGLKITFDHLILTGSDSILYNRTIK